MQQMKTLVTLLFMIFLSFSASAEIDVLQVVPDYAGICSGRFTVRANGTAGPFTVVVTNPIKGQPDIVHNNVTSSVDLEDLCNGNYQVRVFPTRFPSCVTFLEAVLEDLKQEEELYNDKVLGFDVSPNPTRGEVLISITEEKMVASSGEGEWTVTVTDANGLPLQEHNQVGTEKTSLPSFPLDLSRYPRGVYFIQVTAPGGMVESRRVVLQ